MSACLSVTLWAQISRGCPNPRAVALPPSHAGPSEGHQGPGGPAEAGGAGEVPGGDPDRAAVEPGAEVVSHQRPADGLARRCFKRTPTHPTQPPTHAYAQHTQTSTTHVEAHTYAQTQTKTCSYAT